MDANAISLPLTDQTTLSESVRVTVKRIAAENGGLKSLLAELGLPYKKAWEQLNRNQGVLVDMLPALTLAGVDEPLRIVADACGYHVQPKPQFLRKADPPKPVRSYGLAIHHVATRITLLMEEALSDQRIDEREREAIKARVHEARKVLAEFEERITP